MLIRAVWQISARHVRAWRLAVSRAVINHSRADHMPPWSLLGSAANANSVT
jgi:hypothetical protein